MSKYKIITRTDEYILKIGESYEKLVNRWKKIYNLKHVGAIARYDKLTIMPKEGAHVRGKAIASLKGVVHELKIDPVIRNWIQKAEKEDLSKSESWNLNAMKREYFQEIALVAFVENQEIATMNCQSMWHEMKKKNDWDGIVEPLREVVRLARKECEMRFEANMRNDLMSEDKNVKYDAMLDLYEPGMTSQRIDEIFADMKTWLPKLVQQVIHEQKNEPKPMLPK